MEDRTFLGLPDSGHGAIRVTATVASRAAGKFWFNDEVVVVDPGADNVISGEAAGGPAQTEGGAVIKTFRSTGIGNEASFDEETAEEWRRKKEQTRPLLERNRKLDGRQSASLGERHGFACDDAGSSDV